MDKKERNKVKRTIKKEVNRLIGQDVCGTAKFIPDNGTWELWLSVDFEIPAPLSLVKEGMDKDIQQAEVISYMKEKEQEIVSILKEHFEAVYEPQKEFDFNFTVAFPPMFSTTSVNGVPRLKTSEEKEQDKIRFPSLADMIEVDDKIIEAGYFEFRGKDGIPEYDGFVLIKYADLRARYKFIIPQDKVAV